MLRTECVPKKSIDWRGWLTLAWVVWFGILYASMIVERRGAKMRAFVRPGNAVSTSR